MLGRSMRIRAPPMVPKIIQLEKILVATGAMLLHGSLIMLLIRGHWKSTTLMFIRGRRFLRKKMLIMRTGSKRAPKMEPTTEVFLGKVKLPILLQRIWKIIQLPFMKIERVPNSR